MRELTLDELELISGGAQTTEVDEIVVVADGGDGGGDFGDWGDWGDWGDYGDYGDGGGDGGGGDYTEPPPPTDESSVDVTLGNITRELTPTEQKAVDDFKAEKDKMTQAINSLPDNAELTLPDGSKVTGAELKDLWAKTDFVINEVGTTYRNGTDRGEADYRDGDPQVSFNIDNVVGYSQSPGGLSYLGLHEVGHMTETGRAHNGAGAADNEQVANDIARAIGNYGGLPILANPNGGGYSTTDPLIFNIPGAGAGGGGGGGGGGGDIQQH